MATITFYHTDGTEHSWLLENTGAMPDHSEFVTEIARSVGTRCVGTGVYLQVVLSFGDESRAKGFQSWKEIKFYKNTDGCVLEEASTVTISTLTKV